MTRRSTSTPARGGRWSRLASGSALALALALPGAALAASGTSENTAQMPEGIGSNPEPGTPDRSANDQSSFQPGSGASTVTAPRSGTSASQNDLQPGSAASPDQSDNVTGTSQSDFQPGARHDEE